MKLAALGGAVGVLGIALSITGLIATGALWIVTGPIARAYGSAWERRRTEQGSAPGGAWMAGSTMIFLLIGLPSLAIGIFEIGFDEPDAEWRWLPIGIGGLVAGIGLVGGLMYALGSGIQAATGPAPTHPAKITIRAARETGMFINERPRLEFDLTVEPEGMAAYEVTKNATVPFTALGSIRPGDGFKALVVGPGEPESIEIDWSSPIPASSE